MEPLAEDGAWTRELIALANAVRAQKAYADEPLRSVDRDQRTAIARIRNRLRQAVELLDVAAETSRAIR